MCIGATDIRAMEEGAVLDMLCEACLAKVGRKLHNGGTLFDHGQDEYGFCQECGKRIEAVLEKLQAGQMAEAEGASSPPRASE